MKDRELVQLAKTSDKYKGELYFRYENLCYKHLHILERQVGYSEELKDDFMGDTYEVFLKALKGVKITEIKNDKWLFLGWYGFFLKNLRIKYVKEIFKQRENETSLFKSGGDGKEYLLTDVAGIHAPDVYEEIEDKLAFKSIYKELTVRQRFIVDHKKLNYKNMEIASLLGVSNTLITFELKDIKAVILARL